MKQTPSGVAKSHSTGQEIPCLLQKLKVYYHVLNSLPLVPILSHVNPGHNLKQHKRFILTLSSNPWFGTPTGLLLSSLLTHFSQSICVCYKHPSHFFFSILIILGEYYKLCNFSLYNFFHPLIPSSLQNPNIFFCTLSSVTLNNVIPSNWDTKFL